MESRSNAVTVNHIKPMAGQPRRPSLRKDKAYVLRLAKEHDVRFIRLWFTDILGFLKSFAITVDELEKALEEGMGFDGSSIEGFARIDESDMIALPDPNTFCLLPWRPKENAVARMLCDITYPGGRLFEGDPRHVLKRHLAQAAKLGYTFYVGPELEFFFFKSAEAPIPLDAGGYFDLTPLDAASDLRRDIILSMEEMGIGIEYSHHEAAPSQHEIDFRYTDALTMADNVMTYRLVVKEIAFKHGVYASFMPKPLADRNGSGMHVNMSLFTPSHGSPLDVKDVQGEEVGHPPKGSSPKPGRQPRSNLVGTASARGTGFTGERNAFFEEKDPLHLSKVAKQFMAGILTHAPEMTLVLNQWVNSYKRLVPGYEAPVYVTWAQRNRSDLIRIPMYKPGKEASTRIELRSPDPACNPYLAFSVILAAGLEGIDERLPLPEPTEENALKLTEAERARRGIAMLPGSLGEAIALARDSKFLRRALGEHVFQSFLQNKQIEHERFRRTLTDYELKTYLPLL